MGLFKKKQKALFEQRFIQSKTFRGHKRFYVSYYGYQPAEQGVARLRRSGNNLDGAEILLKKSDKEPRLEVYVNGNLIGSVPEYSLDEAQRKVMNSLYNGRVNSAHVHIEYENVYSVDKKGKAGFTERERFLLFLKEASDE